MPTGRFLSRKEILFDLEIVTWPPMGTARRFLRMSWPKLDTVKIGSGRPRRRSLMTSARQERMNRPASLRGFFEEEFLPGGLTEPMTIPVISAKTLWRLRAASRRRRSLTSTWMSSKKRMWHFQLNSGGAPRYWISSPPAGRPVRRT